MALDTNRDLGRWDGKSPKISVVVPIYNAETHLEECLASIVSQADISLQIILVDDGSTDSSGAMCNAFASDKPDIVNVIHKPNAGVAAARNTGMSEATGDYVMFVDSDDVLPVGSIRSLLNSAFAYDSDMVYGEHAIILNDQVGESVGELGNFPDGEVSPRAVLASLASTSPQSISGSCCRALFRTSFLKRSTARFPEGIAISEDYDFILQCLVAKPKVSIVHSVVYWVRRGSVSVTQRYLTSVGHDMGIVNEHLRKICEGDSELTSLYCASAANAVWSECSNAYKRDSPLSRSERWQLIKDALRRGDGAIRGTRRSSGLPKSKFILLKLGRTCPLILFFVMEVRGRHA